MSSAPGSRGRVFISTNEKNTPPIMINPTSNGLQRSRFQERYSEIQENTVGFLEGRKLVVGGKHPSPRRSPPLRKPSPAPSRIPFNDTDEVDEIEEPGESLEYFENYPPLPPLRGALSSIGGPNLSPNSNIKYYGGPVQSESISVYLIFAGTWKSSEKEAIKNFVRSLGDTSMRSVNGSLAQWWNVALLYYDQLGNHVSPNVLLGKTLDVSLTHGSALSDAGNMIRKQLTLGNLPIDPNGQYHVLTSPDIKEGGFCQSYCGYHTYFWMQADIGSGLSWYTIPWSFVGNPGTQCPWNCAAPWISQHPNGNTGIDGMISVLAHEASEIATDPLINAWLNWEKPGGGEIADLCAWSYGNTKSTSTGITYTNQGSAGTYFFIQMLFHPITGQCLNSISVPANRCGVDFGGYPCLPGSCCSHDGYCGVCPGPPPPPGPAVPPPPSPPPNPPPRPPSSPPPVPILLPPSTSPPPPFPPHPPPPVRKSPPPVKRSPPPVKKSPPPVKKSPPPQRKIPPPPPLPFHGCGDFVSGYAWQPNTATKGIDKRVFISTMIKCARTCQEIRGCVGFVYQIRNSKCFVKGSMDTPTAVVGFDTFSRCTRTLVTQTSPPLPPLGCSSIVPNFKMEANKNFPGNNLLYFYGDNWSCSRMCMMQSKCIAFQHIPASKACFLKSATTTAVVTNGSNFYSRCP